MPNNLYVVSHIPGKMFSLDTFEFVDNTADPLIYDPEQEGSNATFGVPGCGMVLHKKDEVFTSVELSVAERELFTYNKDISKVLNDHINDCCTGMIVYDVAWWAMPFNTFMEGFSDRHFEV
jgi:hypothetical protein